MHVERSLESFVVQEFEHPRRIGEIAAVPRVAAPAPHLSAQRLLEVGTVPYVPVLVPVHLDYAHVHRDADGIHLAHDLAVVGFAVVPEPAPPVAERPARRQRYAPGYLHVVAEASLVVVPVGKHGDVAVRALFALRTLLHPFLPVIAALDEKRSRRVVHNRHAATGKDSLLHARQQILDAGSLVDRAHRAEKILLVFRQRGHAVHCKVLSRERAARPLQTHLVRRNYRALAVARKRMTDRRQDARGESQAGTILERTVRAPFAAHHAVGQEGEPRLPRELDIPLRRRHKCGTAYDGKKSLHFNSTSWVFTCPPLSFHARR